MFRRFIAAFRRHPERGAVSVIEMAAALTVGGLLLGMMAQNWGTFFDQRLDWRDAVDNAASRAVSVLEQSSHHAEIHYRCSDGELPSFGVVSASPPSYQRLQGSGAPVYDSCEQVSRVGRVVWRAPTLAPVDDTSGRVSLGQELDGWEQTPCIMGSELSMGRYLDCWWHERPYISTEDDRGCHSLRVVRIYEIPAAVSSFVEPWFHYDIDRQYAISQDATEPFNIIVTSPAVDSEGWSCSTWTCENDHFKRCPQIVDSTGGSISGIERIEWTCIGIDNKAVDCPEPDPDPTNPDFATRAAYVPAVSVKADMTVACPPEASLDIEDCRALVNREQTGLALFPGEGRQRVYYVQVGR